RRARPVPSRGMADAIAVDHPHVVGPLEPNAPEGVARSDARRLIGLFPGDSVVVKDEASGAHGPNVGGARSPHRGDVGIFVDGSFGDAQLGRAASARLYAGVAGRGIGVAARRVS